MREKVNLWIYSDITEQQRIAGSLVVFGAEVFHGAKIINELQELKDLKQGIENRTIPIQHPHLYSFFTEYLIDCIRILVFFENYMKGELITHGICVYNIDKNQEKFKLLAKQQVHRPISMEEIHHVENFVVDKENQFITHTAILNKTIGMQQLLFQEEYYKHYFTHGSRIIGILRDINQFRNQLHFHSSITFTLSDELIENIEILKEFVNGVIKRIQT